MMRENSIPVTVAGTTLTSTGTAVSASLPTNSAGRFPLAVRVAASSAAHVRLGYTATTNDLLVQPGDSVCLFTGGYTAITVISNSGTASVTIVPVEIGSYYPDLSAPALLLDFTGTQELDSRITFTRSTTATRFNSSGVLESVAINSPRFDYDPVTLDPKGLLIEEQRTNLLVRSEEFENASWTKARATVTANAAVSPDGTQDADKLIEDTTASNSHFVEQAVSVTSGTSYTFSFYAKAAERTSVAGQFFIGATTGVVFNLANGTITSGTGGTIAPVGNGWYRCTVTATATATGTGFFDIFLYNGSVNYTGNGTSGVFIWGAQLEAGSFATSYIPTTTAQVTRAADVATMTGANFSNWYNQTEGTLFAEFGPYGNGGASKNPGVFQIDDGTANNTVRVFAGSSVSPVFNVSVGGTAQAYLSTGTLTPTSVSKIASAYKTNDFARSFNGAAADVDATGTTPVVNTMRIGVGSSGVSELNGTIRRIAYYSRRLSNTELQGLTQ